MKEGFSPARYPENLPAPENNETKERIVEDAQEQRRTLLLEIYAKKAANYFKNNGIKYASYVPVISIFASAMESHRGLSLGDRQMLSAFERMQRAELAASTAFYYLTFASGDSPEHFLAGLYSAGLTISVSVDTIAKQIWPELHAKAKTWAANNKESRGDFQRMKELLLKILQIKNKKND